MKSIGNKLEVKYFTDPKEVRAFNKGKVELVSIGDVMVARTTWEPGWKWSIDIKPSAKTEWCEVQHFLYVISGTMHVKMTDGKEIDLRPGSVSLIPPGHDGWVVGNKPVVAIDLLSVGHHN
jgi:hypothetical protein